MDIQRNTYAVAGPTPDQVKHFVEHTGIAGSYLEGSVLEQVLFAWQGTALSTMQVLLDANSQNIPLYRIDASNVDHVMPRLAFADPEVLHEIRQAIAAGLVVTVPERVPSKEVGTAGIGYVLHDPVTGAGAYRIAGGLDGGEGEGPCDVPEPEPVVDDLRDVVLTLVVLAAVIALIAASGGTVAPALAGILIAMGFVSLTRPVTAGPGWCNPIPAPRRGGDDIHNQCADTRLGNAFAGTDVCVAAPGFGQKHFDAFDGLILWEVKTYNAANGNLAFLVSLDQPEWVKENGIARVCGYHFWYTVGAPVILGFSNRCNRTLCLSSQIISKLTQSIVCNPKNKHMRPVP